MARNCTAQAPHMAQNRAGVANPTRRQIARLGCQAPRSKIFRFTGILIYGRPLPARAAMRGASRSSRNVARVAMDACGVRLASASPAKTLQRTVKSCGPGAATVASIPAGLCWQGNGDKQRRSPGRARISRQPIARGRPGCLGCTCSVLPVRFGARDARVLRRTGSTGAVGARPSLRPLIEEGQRIGKARAENALRE